MLENSKKTIYECVKKYIPSINEEMFDVDFEKMGLDSISAISLIVDIEEILNLEFDDDDLVFSKINSINKLFEIIRRYEQEDK